MESPLHSNGRGGFGRRLRESGWSRDQNRALSRPYDWVHPIEVEKALPRDPGVAYPRCLTGRRACPPEDCGGPWGYANFIEAITEPRHEKHDELLEWVGGAFDPSRFDVEDINKRLTVP
ncbi:plasmid pRiA4b ORF-3 family protein [Streptomyces sp. NPDC056149]|uniref:plasmid pRiA4b ORF-3 family protein n=1 Tax=Streptomyces sp. NPDC056149 TaxID=3345728 RepID=UPI0035DD317A